MATNNWQIGAMYGNGYVSGQPFYTQPGGIGTQTFPSQPQAQPWPAWPAAGIMMYNFGGFWLPGCLHWVDFWDIIREFDYGTNSSVALICCPVCKFVQRTIEPFEEWLNPIQQAIIVA